MPNCARTYVSTQKPMSDDEEKTDRQQNLERDVFICITISLSWPQIEIQITKFIL